MLPNRPRTRVLLIAAVLVASALSLTAQPRLVKDINVSINPVGSAPEGVRSIGDITYFYAQHAQTGYELWKTDGTEAGTTLVRDLNPGPYSGVNPNFISTRVLGNRLIFVGTDGVRWGFWATDGTAQGTVRLSNTSVDFSRHSVP